MLSCKLLELSYNYVTIIDILLDIISRKREKGGQNSECLVQRRILYSSISPKSLSEYVYSWMFDVVCILEYKAKLSLLINPQRSIDIKCPVLTQKCAKYLTVDPTVLLWNSEGRKNDFKENIYVLPNVSRLYVKMVNKMPLLIKLIIFWFIYYRFATYFAVGKYVRTHETTSFLMKRWN